MRCFVRWNLTSSNVESPETNGSHAAKKEQVYSLLSRILASRMEPTLVADEYYIAEQIKKKRAKFLHSFHSLSVCLSAVELVYSVQGGEWAGCTALLTTLQQTFFQNFSL